MKNACLFLLATSFLFAGDLKVDLEKQIQSGELTNSVVEAALIAEGVHTAAELATYTSKYEQLKSDLALSGKQLKGNAKKKAKALHKNVFANLKTLDTGTAGLRGLLDNRSYNVQLATWLLAHISEAAGLSAADWAATKKHLDPDFVAAPAKADVILAAHLTNMAANLPAEKGSNLPLLASLATHLAPQSTYGEGVYDAKIYNDALANFNANKFQQAAWQVQAGATRYPQQKAFQPLAFNVGFKLVEAENFQAAQPLMPFMGDNLPDFKTTINTQRYNIAARFYNKKDYAKAIELLEQIKTPPAGVNYKGILSTSYAVLAEDYVTKGKAVMGEELLAKLDKIDPNRGQRTRQRLEQLRLKGLVESGDLQNALNEASKQLDSDVDRNNYKSVFIQLMQELRKQKQFQKALDLTKSVPSSAQLGETFQNEIFNTYAEWIESKPAQDFQAQFPIYKKMFADSRVKLTEKNREIITENYATLRYLKITKLIEDRKFEQANTENQQALKEAPNHKNLLEQRKLIETILKRLK